MWDRGVRVGPCATARIEAPLTSTPCTLVQVTRKAVEEAGRKAVLIPGGLEDEEHIK